MASHRQLQRRVQQFNKRCLPGTVVSVEMDDGTFVETTVRYKATIMGGHTAVGWFEGIAGCYLLSRVRKGAPDARSQ